MKFKNITKQVINMKVDGEWAAIEPEEFIEISYSLGKNQEGLQLEELEENVFEEEDFEEVDSDYDYLEESELKSMTKDKLNDYASDIGLKELTTSIKKSEMIEEILKYQNEN